ncbi:hypothetical protein ONZ45_g7661 [Pleurotus djamor]|nr:hypothetical protein ONZ45_g7661 [Pleurotus djamor]
MLRPWFLAIILAWGTSAVVGGEGPAPKIGFLDGSGEDVDYPSNPTPTFDAEATATYSGLPCKFTFTPEKSMMHYIYDVCPLLHRHKHDGNNDGGNKDKNVEVDERPIRIRIEEKTPPTLTTSVYDLALRTSLKRNGTLPAELQVCESTLRYDGKLTMGAGSVPMILEYA